MRGALMVEATAVLGQDLSRNLVGAFPVHQRDDRAAEASSRHACRDRAGVVGEDDEQIELGDRHLEVVAQACLALAEETTEFVGGCRPVSRRIATTSRTRWFSVSMCLTRAG